MNFTATYTGAEPPSSLDVVQYNLTSIIISWEPPISGPEVSGYTILYAVVGMDPLEIRVDGATTSLLVDGLQSGETYQVSAFAHSFFPGMETDPVEIFLCKPHFI